MPRHLKISVTCEENKDRAIIRLLKKHPDFKNHESIIIYCSRRKETVHVAELLNDKLLRIERTFVEDSNSSDEDSSSEEQESTTLAKRSKSPSSSSKRRRVQRFMKTAAFYHAGMKGPERFQVQKQFTKGRLRIVVATVAFGMGLNIPAIRAIIHYDIPKSFESFVQEIGRAGRDGQPAYCHVFIDKEKHDVCELRRHAYNDTVDSGTVKTLLDKIFPACRCPEQGQSQQTLPTPSPDSTHSPPTLSLPRSCRGHERVISIEETGRSLDINEECIATFLCYLEQQNWLKIISVFNDTCTLSWSGGETQLKAMRDKVRAVDEAIKFVGNGTNSGTSGKMTFSVAMVANSIGQKFDFVHSQLSSLENSEQEIGVCSANKVSVQFSGQAYLIQSLGGFSRKEHEHIMEYLYERMEIQEKRQLERLYLIHAALCSQSKISPFDQDNSDSEIDAMTDEGEKEKPDIETMIQQYFSEDSLNRAYLSDFKIPVWPLNEKTTSLEKRRVSNDIQSLVASIKDYNFTGKSVARIFHGIASPHFNHLWGYKYGSRFWRRHLDISFDNLCKIANEKLSSIY